MIHKKHIFLIGPMGAGKTTILKTISGAIDPRKGKITLNGKEIQKKDPDKILKLGMSHSPEGREVFSQSRPVWKYIEWIYSTRS